MKPMTREARQLLARMLLNETTQIDLSAYGHGGTDLKFGNEADYEKFLEAMEVTDLKKVETGLGSVPKQMEGTKKSRKAG